MDGREKGFTQGVGWAIRFIADAHGDEGLAEFMAEESGISLNDFKKVCDEGDVPFIKKALKERRNDENRKINFNH